MRTVVAIVTDNLPIKKNVLYLGTAPDVVDDHVIPVLATLVHDDTDVGNSAP